VRAGAAALKFAFEGTDGGALGAHYIDIDANQTIEIDIRMSANRQDGRLVYVASTTAAAAYTLVCEPE